MAVMGRKKRAVARGWEATNKQREEQVNKSKEEFESKHNKEITKEEDEARIKMLREIGVLKD